MAIPELLAPAGSLEKLATALAYGADAVYAGVEQFSLRARGGCLSQTELPHACELVQRHGAQLYLTLNAFLHPGEEAALRRLLSELRPLPVDAYTVADPGVLSLIRALVGNLVAQKLTKGVPAVTQLGWAMQRHPDRVLFEASDPPSLPDADVAFLTEAVAHMREPRPAPEPVRGAP